MKTCFLFPNPCKARQKSVACTRPHSIEKAETGRPLLASWAASLAELVSSRPVRDPVCINKVGLGRWLRGEDACWASLRIPRFYVKMDVVPFTCVIPGLLQQDQR